MNIVDMSLVVPVVPYGMLPKATLPEGRLSVLVTCDRRPRFHDGFRKSAFDEQPSVRVVRVPFRQRHDNVQVVRQRHDRIDGERTRAARLPHGGAQSVDVIDPRGSIYERQGEEKRAA
jgi:hypothetical protein